MLFGTLWPWGPLSWPVGPLIPSIPRPRLHNIPPVWKLRGTEMRVLTHGGFYLLAKTALQYFCVALQLRVCCSATFVFVALQLRACCSMLQCNFSLLLCFCDVVQKLHCNFVFLAVQFRGCRTAAFFIFCVYCAAISEPRRHVFPDPHLPNPHVRFTDGSIFATASAKVRVIVNAIAADSAKGLVIASFSPPTVPKCQ